MTFRSRKLKKTILLEEDMESDGLIELVEDVQSEEKEDLEKEEKLSRKERKARNKQLRKDRKAQKHLHTLENGDVVDETEYDPEELEDLRISAILNKDGFYDALEPIDLGQFGSMKTKAEFNNKNILIIAGMALAGIAAVAYLVISIANIF